MFAQSSVTRRAAALLVLIGATTALGAASWQVAVPQSRVLDSAQLLTDLRRLSADDMQGRQVGTAGGDKARAYVIERFKASGVLPFGESYESPFTFSAGGRAAATATERRGVNVLGRIDGSRPERLYIVVSAHYDHVGARGGEVFNGADDNASGTAALFAVAKYFAVNRPANSIIFAAFDAEEVGLRGARAFVRTPPVDGRSLAINLNMDMIGREPDDKLFVVGTRLQPALRPFIDRLAPRVPVKLLTGHEDPAGKEDWTRDSDHYAFMEAGIPALYFGVEDFAQHHKASDDFDTMSHSFYVRAVETMIEVVKEFDANLNQVPPRTPPPARLPLP